MAVYSIITGASKGIGRALAVECAEKGRNLILVSLPGEGLSRFSAELSDSYDICTRYYETDLTAKGSIEEFYRWCSEENLQIDMLINNAGLGSQGSFELSTPAKFQNMMDLNMNVLVSMCWGAMPFLKKNDKSYILNVGSIGSFTPVPYKTIYSASKHFVLAFSDALYYELKNSPVFVACLCPGPTLTSSLHEAKIKEQGLPAELLTKKADEVAEYALKGLLKGKRIIIPGIGNKFIALLGRLLPVRWRLKLAGAAFSNSEFHHYDDRS